MEQLVGDGGGQAAALADGQISQDGAEHHAGGGVGPALGGAQVFLAQILQGNLPGRPAEGVFEAVFPVRRQGGLRFPANPMREGGGGAIAAPTGVADDEVLAADAAGVVAGRAAAWQPGPVVEQGRRHQGEEGEQIAAAAHQAAPAGRTCRWCIALPPCHGISFSRVSARGGGRKRPSAGPQVFPQGGEKKLCLLNKYYGGGAPRCPQPRRWLRTVSWTSRPT